LLGLQFKVDVGTTAQVLRLFIGVAILSFVNATLGRLIKILTIPLNCLTLGLFSLVVNALMLLLVASLNIGFSIPDSTPTGKFLAALVASILISFVNGILGSFIPDKEEDE
jgi:putative membrane protein